MERLKLSLCMSDCTYVLPQGLYPDDHGIVANEFYDPDFKGNFNMTVKDGKWWGGEPIWNTVTMQVGIGEFVSGLSSGLRDD